ncbi:MAG TPA: hypothetical protein VHK89_07450 [Actinomycetota bacterium]|nr:hypothetical protein [Actinomycetota bacterium]
MAEFRSATAWKYPLRAATDLLLIVLGLLVATWPLVALVLILRLVF